MSLSSEMEAQPLRAGGGRRWWGAPASGWNPRCRFEPLIYDQLGKRRGHRSTYYLVHEGSQAAVSTA